MLNKLISNRLVLLLIILLIYNNPISQLSIKGIIQEENGIIPLIGVKLYKANDTIKIFQYVSSDINGYYNFTNLDSNTNYIIKILNSNFEHYYYEISSTNSDIEHNIILKINTKILNNIEIEGRKIIQNGLKTTFIINEKDKKTNKNGLDIINNIPKIKYNPITNDIKDNENKSVILMINGIEATENEVKSIDIRKIKKIEIIEAVDMKYLERNVNKILNYTIEDYKGFGFYFGTEQGFNVNHNDSYIGANYNIGKHVFNFDFNYIYRNYNDVYYKSEKNYLNENFIANYYQMSNKNTLKYKTILPSFKYTYIPNDKLLFIVKTSSNNMIDLQKDNSGEFYYFDNKDTIINNISDKEFNNNNNIFFQFYSLYKYNSKNSISIDFQFDNYFSKTDFLYNDSKTDLNYRLINNYYQFHTDIEQKLKINNSINFSFGLVNNQYATFQQVNNDLNKINLNNIKIYSSSNFNFIPDKSNLFFTITYNMNKYTILHEIQSRNNGLNLNVKYNQYINKYLNYKFSYNLSTILPDATSYSNIEYQTSIIERIIPFKSNKYYYHIITNELNFKLLAIKWKYELSNNYENSNYSQIDSTYYFSNSKIYKINFNTLIIDYPLKINDNIEFNFNASYNIGKIKIYENSHVIPYKTFNLSTSLFANYKSWEFILQYALPLKEINTYGISYVDESIFLSLQYNYKNFKFSLSSFMPFDKDGSKYGGDFNFGIVKNKNDYFVRDYGNSIFIGLQYYIVKGKSSPSNNSKSKEIINSGMVLKK